MAITLLAALRASEIPPLPLELVPNPLPPWSCSEAADRPRAGNSAGVGRAAWETFAGSCSSVA